MALPKAEPIVALFDDPAQARRLCGELKSVGLPPDEMTLIEASSHKAAAGIADTLVDAGLVRSDAELFADEIRGGATFLAVRVRDTDRPRIAEIISRHAPTRPGRADGVAQSTANDASVGRAPQVTPMPTGSGALDSRSDPSEEGGV